LTPAKINRNHSIVKSVIKYQIDHVRISVFDSKIMFT